MSSLSRLVYRLHDRFHEQRAQLFVRLLRPEPGMSLLDLGGGSGALAARVAARVPLRVTVADVTTQHRAAVEAHGFRYVQLHAGEPLPFHDGEFDLVLCNSVIEHVTLPRHECEAGAVSNREWRRRAAAAQAAFAREIDRVGRGWFVQTPHRHFPIEAHLWLPFVNYLPHSAVARLGRITERFWVKKLWGPADWEYLAPRDMRRLFPGARIVVERFAGLPKSIVAWRAAPAAVALAGVAEPGMDSVYDAER